MENFKELICYFFGQVYVPKELKHLNSNLLLHISDTPTIFYSPLRKLINKLKPTYIIHTGDLVDNIKLEIFPARKDEYTVRLKKLISILEKSSAKKIYICLGNHDHKKIVKKITNKCFLIDLCRTLDIENNSIQISHFSFEILKHPVTYNLFGHDLSLNTKIENNHTYLNGISGINIIDLNTKKIYILPYPYGTNSHRMGRSSVGL